MSQGTPTYDNTQQINAKEKDVVVKDGVGASDGVDKDDVDSITNGDGVKYIEKEFDQMNKVPIISGDSDGDGDGLTCSFNGKLCMIKERSKHVYHHKTKYKFMNVPWI